MLFQLIDLLSQEDKKFTKVGCKASVSAEGCFYIELNKYENLKLKETARLMFIITQHSRDEKLIRSFIAYFQCGTVSKNRETFQYRVTKFSEIVEKIIPYFKNNPILGTKQKDFDDWCEVAILIKYNKHLTMQGLEQIRQIKAGMNRKRISG